MAQTLEAQLKWSLVTTLWTQLQEGDVQDSSKWHYLWAWGRGPDAFSTRTMYRYGDPILKSLVAFFRHERLQGDGP